MFSKKYVTTMNIFQFVFVIVLVAPIFGWENLPGRRAEYFVVKDNGGYEYGYDNGDGSLAKQSGSEVNEINGHFAYPSGDGQLIDIKYTAGVDGYVPFTSNAESTSSKTAYASYGSANKNSGPIPASAAGYSYSYNTNHGSQPVAKESKGSYAYTNHYGTESSASLKSNNLDNGGYSYSVQSTHPKSPTNTNEWTVKQYSAADDVNGQQHSDDASYRFEYSSDDSSRHEEADAAGNVQGQYSFTNEAGQHDLKYVAGASTGFVVTGGSLAIPNGIDGGATVRQLQGTSSKLEKHTDKSNQWYNSPTTDGSYAYSFNTGSTASTSQDNAGYLNTKNLDTSAVVYDKNEQSVGSADASYRFAYKAGDSARQEIADGDGSVQGHYSYTNEAGQHDLHYTAGAGTGFVVTGGSLSVPNGIDGGATVRQLAGSTTDASQTLNAHRSNGVVVAAADAYQSGQVSAGSGYKLKYQVGVDESGSAQQKYNDNGQFSLTKLLPTRGNSKYGYILESQ